jgi:hypothetical protein
MNWSDMRPQSVRPSYADLEYVIQVIGAGQDYFDKRLASLLDDIYTIYGKKFHDELLDLGIAFILYKAGMLLREEVARNASR